MKTKMVLLVFSALIFAVLQGCGPAWVTTQTTSTYSDQNNYYQDPPAYQQYDINIINQYGSWENDNSYGRVWRPRVSTGWQPFTNGHWANDGNDWVWVSREPFGGIVYHYGGWEYTPEYGWVWIPETNVWSPACVQWVYYGDQVCWAPRRAHNGNWSDPWDRNNMHYWVAVRMEDFNRDNIGSYRMKEIPPARTDQKVVIERREPNISVIRTRVQDPNKIYRIERTQVQREPVRNDVKPPVDNRKAINPPVDRTRTDVKPPVDNRKIVTPPVDRTKTTIKPPVDNRKIVTPPVDRTKTTIKPPVDNRKIVTPPIDRTKTTIKPPVDNRKIVTPPVDRTKTTIKPPVDNRKIVTPPVKENIRKVVPPKGTQKVDQKRPVKEPVKTDTKRDQVDSKTKADSGNGRR